MIHCVGNSHCLVFVGAYDPVWFCKPYWPTKRPDKLPYFRTYYLGPITAYNFYDHQPKVLQIAREIPKDDYIMLCVGEIDCRWNLPLQAEKQGVPVNALVTECVYRYFRSAKDLLDLGYKVILWNVHPSSRTYQKDITVGDCRSRVEIARLFNDKLHQLSELHGCFFLTIFNKLLSEDGLTNMEYLAPDNNHLMPDKVMPLILAELRMKLNEAL